MLIGALIGLAIHSVIGLLAFCAVQSQVDRHNKALGGSLAKFTGEAKVHINYHVLIMSGVTFTSVGAVIGYFI